MTNKNCNYITIKKISLFILLLSCTSSILFSKEKLAFKDKYKNYIFNPQMKHPNKILKFDNNVINQTNTIIANYFQLKSLTKILNTNIIYEIDKDIYLVGGYLYYKLKKTDFITSDGISIKTKLKNCNLKKSPKYCSDNMFWGSVNLKNSTFLRIADYPIIPGMKETVNFGYVPLGIINNSTYYGCIPRSEFGKVDINLDGNNELISFSGTGEDDFGHVRVQPELSKARLYFSIYSTNHIFSPIFSFLLVETNIEYTEKSGEIQYSKLFFLDTNNNNKLDIFIWSKNIDVTVKSGFPQKFRDESFQLYQGNKSSFSKNTNYTQKMLKQLKIKLNLKWVKGYPNKDTCSYTFGPDKKYKILNQGNIE